MPKNQNVPALPPAVRVAVHPPRWSEPAKMCTLGDKCIAAGTANPGTIGLAPYLAPLVAANAAVKAAIPAANDGGTTAKTALRAVTKKLHSGIMAHAGWVDRQMADMTPADAAAYAVLAGFTSAKQGTHLGITTMAVKNGPVGSSLVTCEFPNTPGRILSCTEYSVDGEKTWTRGPDTETSHVDLPLVFTGGQTVAVRMRQFLRGSGYGPWEVFRIMVV
jgi:hypothetical protein